MSRRKIKQCIVYRCEQLPHLGGRCQQHHEEYELAQRRRRDGVDLIHKWTVDQQRITDDSVQADVKRLCRYFEDAARKMQIWQVDIRKNDERLRTADLIVDVCVGFAIKLVDVERAHRQPSADKYPLWIIEDARPRVWKNLADLGGEIGIGPHDAD